MSLSGAQISSCDRCERVDEVKPAWDQLLCESCLSIRCPRCGKAGGHYRPDRRTTDCPHCNESYIEGRRP